MAGILVVAVSVEPLVSIHGHQRALRNRIAAIPTAPNQSRRGRVRVDVIVPVAQVTGLLEILKPEGLCCGGIGRRIRSSVLVAVILILRWSGSECLISPSPRGLGDTRRGRQLPFLTDAGRAERIAHVHVFGPVGHFHVANSAAGFGDAPWSGVWSCRASHVHVEESLPGVDVWTGVVHVCVTGCLHLALCCVAAETDSHRIPLIHAAIAGVSWQSVVLGGLGIILWRWGAVLVRDVNHLNGLSDLGSASALTLKNWPVGIDPLSAVSGGDGALSVCTRLGSESQLERQRLHRISRLGEGHGDFLVPVQLNLVRLTWQDSGTKALLPWVVRGGPDELHVPPLVVWADQDRPLVPCAAPDLKPSQLLGASDAVVPQLGLVLDARALREAQEVGRLGLGSNGGIPAKGTVGGGEEGQDRVSSGDAELNSLAAGKS